jgi:PAS domain S-box-containing protein
MEWDWDQFARQSLDLLSITNEQGFFVWLSPNWENALGYTLDELHAHHFTEFVHEDHIRSTLRRARELVETGVDVIGFTNQYRHKNGTLRWFEWNVSHTHDGLYYGTARDVTARMAREFTQRERLDLLEAAETHAKLGRFRVNLRTGEGTWSPTVGKLVGLPAGSDSIDMSDSLKLLHPDDRERVAEVLNQGIARKEEFTYVARILGADGKIRWISTVGRVMCAEDGTPAILHGLVSDVTAERERAERLVHTERLATIGQMAAGVAHEINNPLHFLILNLSLLEEGLEGRLSDADLLSLDGAKRGVDRVRRIVDGLRRFARTSPSSRAFSNPLELLDETLAMIRGRFGYGVDISVDIHPDIAYVTVDEQAFVQSLLNLVVNACQAVEMTGERGKVWVRARLEHDGGVEMVIIEVEDEGPGLPADAERIFEPFFTTKPSGEGTGLGLSIARTQVLAQGGDLSLRNREGSRGARATLTLPVIPRVDADASTPPHEPRSKQILDAAEDAPKPGTEPPRSILIVDDESSITRTMSRYLRRHGWEVETASCGERALEIIEAKPQWSLILCDMKMPGLSGTELHERLLAEHPECERSLHFMTGDSWSEDNQMVLLDLDRPHLDKPFSFSELKAFVELNAFT